MSWGPPWGAAAEAHAERIRARCGLVGRVSPERVAEALGFRIKEKQLPTTKLLAYVLTKKRKIVLSSEYPHKRGHSIGHELAEADLWIRLPESYHEAYCDRVGAGILLPRSEFLGSFFDCHGEIPVLRRLWPWASWEALVLRVSDLMPDVYAAAWMGESPKWRTNHSKDQVSAAEIQAAWLAHGRLSRGAALLNGRLAVAWRVPGRGAAFRAVSLCFPVAAEAGRR